MLLGKSMSADRPTIIKKMAFFDRDGIINVNHGYVYKIADVEFVPDIFDLMRHVQALGYEIVVVTNQSGIARGLYSEAEFLKLTQWLNTQFIKQGVSVKHTYYCPHHPTVGSTALTQECDCRKPAIGMLRQASEDFRVDLSHSIMFGDKASDMQCAINAGLRAGYWLYNEEDRGQQFSLLSAHSNGTVLYQINSLAECIHLI